MPFLLYYTVKHPYIHGYFVASFSYFNGISYVYDCIRKSTYMASEFRGGEG